MVFIFGFSFWIKMIRLLKIELDTIVAGHWNFLSSGERFEILDF